MLQPRKKRKYTKKLKASSSLTHAHRFANIELRVAWMVQQLYAQLTICEIVKRRISNRRIKVATLYGGLGGIRLYLVEVQRQFWIQLGGAIKADFMFLWACDRSETSSKWLKHLFGPSCRIFKAACQLTHLKGRAQDWDENWWGVECPDFLIVGFRLQPVLMPEAIPGSRSFLSEFEQRLRQIG